MLSKVTSNRKDKQSKDKQKRKVTIKKVTANLKRNDVKEIHIGKGDQVMTYFDEKKNAIVHEYYTE